MGFEVVYEYESGGFRYDIFVPAKNLLIEFNGLKWHSYQKSKSRDIRKYRHANSNGFGYLCIFEDEWHRKRDCMLNIIKNRIGVEIPESVRPSKCVIERVDSKSADSFYELHHYIGSCMAVVNYGIFLNSELIGCASFKRPSRQSKHRWELVRVASDPRYRVHGVWSKIMKKFITETNAISVVSFSDNRLFTGAVYAKIGFIMESELRSDYYWTKNSRRYHKSRLRKTTAEVKLGLTETELREAQGYRKIWDLGKKRWVLRLVHKHA